MPKVAPKPRTPEKARVKSLFVGLRIDIETRSRIDVKYGAYRYSECPDFRVLVISYAPLRRVRGVVRQGAPRVLDQTNPDEVAKFAKILRDKSFQKHAFNANFERIALSKWLGMPDGEYLDPENWHCSAIRANVNGIFGTLDEVAKAVRSPIAKDANGKRLIKLFSIADKKTGKFHRYVEEGEPFEGRHCWCGTDHAKDSGLFRNYCNSDVQTEAGVAALVPDIPEDVQAEYEMDQRINDRGVRHFKTLSRLAVEQVEAEKNRLMQELQDLTGLDNPNSNQQMQRWLEEQGYPMTSLAKAPREEALADPEIPDMVAKALTMKGSASLSSVAKHKAALDTRCGDGRIRGSLRFYGAHTGREAGRGIQPQNLPRYEAPKADLIRLLNNQAGRDAPTIAKGSVRSSLVPAKGHVFVVCDYNAIEARCLGWLAGEDWVEAEFRGDGKIYEATAVQMFGADKAQLIANLERCDKCGKETCPACVVRGKGKVSNLALGYGGGAGALVTMGAESAGIDVGNYPELNAEWKSLGMPGKFHEWERERHDYPELLRLRDLYREASPETVRFWKHCARAWDVAASGRAVKFGQNNVIGMMRDGRHNRLILPSGRSIWYRFARSHEDPERPDRIDRRTFMGKGTGVGHRRTDTHGGKLTENVTQAVARDVLFDLLMKIERKALDGWPARTVLHVHDEVVLEVPEKHAQTVLEETLVLMSKPPSWGTGLAVKGEGKIMTRYGK